MISLCLWIFCIEFKKSPDTRTLTITGLNEPLDQAQYRHSGDYSFYQKIIMTGITILNNEAFAGSDSLQSVELPSVLHTIGKGCFYKCVNLISIDIPDQVSQIFRETFSGCKSLKFIKLPASLNYLETRNLFAHCGALEEIKISGQNPQFSTLNNGKILVKNRTIAVASVGAFPTVEIPSFIEVIDVNFLLYRGTIRNIKFSEDSNLTSIQNNAFAGTDIVSLNIPEGVTFIGNGILSEASTVNVSLPSTLNEIDKNAFQGADKLKRVFVPSICPAVQQREDGVILDKSGSNLLFFPLDIEEFEIGINLKHVAYSLLRQSNSLFNLTTEKNHSNYYAEGNLLYSSDKSSLYTNVGYNINVTIIKECVSISSFAFMNTKIERVFFESGSRLRSIYISAFINCRKLTFFEFVEGLKTIDSWCFQDTGLLRANMPSSLETMGTNVFASSGIKEADLSLCTNILSISRRAFFGCLSLNKIILPSNFKSIPESFCQSCTNLKAISIPPSVKNISMDAFLDSGIQNITFGDNTVLNTIAESALSGTQIEAIEIPDSVALLDTNCFANCPKLKNLTFSSESKLETIKENIISNSNCIEFIYLGPKVKTIAPTALSGSQSLKTIIVSSLNSNFKNSENNDIIYTKNGSILVLCPAGITHVFVIEEVQTIAESAFYKCSKLSEIIFGSNAKLESISKSTFFGCSNISEISFPKHLRLIEENAFSNCFNLWNVSFGDNSFLEAIEKSAFFNCSMLHYFRFPPLLNKIGENAFSKCINLESIILPGSLKVIERYSFEGCSKLRLASICINSEPEGFSDNAFTGVDRSFVIVVMHSYENERSKTSTLCGIPVVRALDEHCQWPTLKFTLFSFHKMSAFPSLIACINPPLCGKDGSSE